MSNAPAGPLDAGVDWHRRVVGRSLRTARKRSIDRSSALVRAAAALLERSHGEGLTVQEVADEAGTSLRTLYQYFESKDDLLLAVFEEAMGAYARSIREAIVDLDDPVERLAGALLAAARLPGLTRSGVDVALARLRVNLSEVQPHLVGRSQLPVTALVAELVDDATTAGRIPAVDRAAATFLLLALNTAVTTTGILGNDVGVPRPDAAGLVTFCLRGLGAPVDAAGLDAIGARLRLPHTELRLSSP